MNKIGLLKQIAEKYGAVGRDDDFTSSFLNGTVYFDMPSDMEACRRGYDYSAYRTPQNGDGEWTYQFARMEYLHRLVLSFSATGDAKITDKYFSFIHDFFQNNHYENDAEVVDRYGPLKSRILRSFGKSDLLYPTYRTLDTAIRNYSLLIDRFFLEDLFDDKTVERIKSDAIKTVSRLREFDRTSNWGIMICALTACSFLILGCEEAERPLAFLKDCLDNQIDGNGGHTECSATYHTQCLTALLRLLYQAKQARYELDPAFLETAAKMARYSYYHASPTGWQDQNGDSDRTSLNTVFEIARSLLGLEDVAPSNDDRDVYLLMEFPQLSLGKLPDHTQKGGYGLAFRNSYCYNSKEFCVNLYNGVSASSHKHADNGQLSLWYNGSPYIVDGGRYSYSDLKKRSYFRGPHAHSTVLVDHGRSWKEKNPNWFRKLPTVDPMICDLGVACVRYWFNGRETVKRAVRFYDGFIVVVDRVDYKKRHSYRAQWILDPKIVPEPESNCAVKIGELYLNSYLPGLVIENAEFSPSYNEIEKTKMIRFDASFHNEFVNVYSISKRPQLIRFENGRFYIDDPDLRVDLEDWNE